MDNSDDEANAVAAKNLVAQMRRVIFDSEASVPVVMAAINWMAAEGLVALIREEHAPEDRLASMVTMFASQMADLTCDLLRTTPPVAVTHPGQV